ncbi:MAG: EAL domain-containing protein [Spirochaetaceae bacterium]|nr:EAL domain-containing protein [Spirochaetaceae bacterium]MBO5236795.1 EAL domain-containing protein [Spirochaetaceae bacterium]
MNEVEKKLSNADLIKKEYVCSFFQPIVCLGTGKIFAYEALIRGKHPETDTIISPADLFAAADAQNKSVEFDKICQQSALEYFQEFSRSTDALLFMNINTSLLSSDNDHFGNLNALTQKMGFAPSVIGIELIESRAKDSEYLVSFVNRHRETGFLIVVDDFGCEHSNMERLIQIHPDIIKIDRSIICGIESDLYRQSILKSIHGLSQMTGSLCLAEGVETVEEILTCYRLGVDLFQGFGIAKPAFDLAQVEKETISRVKELRKIIKEDTLKKLKEKRRLTGDINSLANWLLKQISMEKLERLHPVFEEFIVMNPEIECIYLLDSTGKQISNTIISPFLEKREGSYIFVPGIIGTDQSFKSYFTCFEAFPIDRYLSDPYLSSASGNLCRTLAVKKYNEKKDEYIILCMDFIEETIKSPIP